MTVRKRGDRTNGANAATVAEVVLANGLGKRDGQHTNRDVKKTRCDDERGADAPTLSEERLGQRIRDHEDRSA